MASDTRVETSLSEKPMEGKKKQGVPPVENAPNISSIKDESRGRQRKEEEVRVNYT